MRSTSAYIGGQALPSAEPREVFDFNGPDEKHCGPKVDSSETQLGRAIHFWPEAVTRNSAGFSLPVDKLERPKDKFPAESPGLALNPPASATSRAIGGLSISKY